MPGPFNNLLTKLEEAAGVVYLASAAPVAVFYGIDDSTRTVPNVTLVAEQGEEVYPGTGNFRCTLTVRVVSNVDDSGANTHAGLAATVFDVFMEDTIAATLSAAVTDLYVFAAQTGTGIPARMNERTEARQHISEIELECVACATDL